MFRTDINHWLQTFDSHALIKFMQYVSFMGTIYMLMLTVLILIAGINFRKGFLILNILGWSALLMLGVKNYFDYPRPIAVDASLESYEMDKTKVDYRDLQPVGFFEGFSDTLLVKTRASNIARYGFPSGHVMIITAIWIGMALLFNNKRLWLVSVSMVILTIFSRLYLGMHYLGDVLGGLAMGLFLAFSFNWLYKRLALKEKLEFIPQHYLFFLVPVVLVFFSYLIPGSQAGALLGLNIALVLIIKLFNEPVLEESLSKRLMNVLLLVIFYFASYFLMRRLPIAKVGIYSMLAFATVNFIAVFVSFYIGYRLNFYQLKNNG